MRLIDADALLLDNTWEWYDEYGNLTVAGRAVENAPTIDPFKDKSLEQLNCGARMDGEADEID